MGLLSIIRRQKDKEREIRILVLGLDNSGKTTIVKKILHEDVDTVSPTMGFQISTIVFDDFTLNIWDIGGQRSLRSFWNNYFEKTDVVMWVVDSVSIEKLEESYKELKEKVIAQDRLIGIYLIILVNKVDLVSVKEHKSLKERIRYILDVDAQFQDESKILVELVSGRTGKGLMSVLNWITTRVY